MDVITGILQGDVVVAVVVVKLCKTFKDRCALLLVVSIEGAVMLAADMRLYGFEANCVVAYISYEVDVFPCDAR
ncbi:hypothetical protein BM547_04170 [Pseudomonas aeruginosa]|nr:hypothetical protein A6R75_15480 [Pseudomonas aeruginosa]KJJ21060.1 hypothetical protein HMPREF3150_01163 [Pseudomonas aeruginosa]KQJ51607.1 hypothetical protein AN280_29105 [Pseudomonas aeruginosa]OFL13273.1 hypothetical protein HMPREF2789_10030 [Pseudomonas aeruginosa]OOK60013.1 hypothetical protein BM547_04170 [Pseudomonas aeruginosa]